MYTIKQASTRCGLPESTLRYYEQVGIIGPIARDEQSHHRVYQDNDIQKLITVSCLSATGMPLADIRQYMRDAPQGEEAAIRQLELLKAQESLLEEQMKELKTQQRYVAYKQQYWTAVREGNLKRAHQLVAQYEDLVLAVAHRKSIAE